MTADDVPNEMVVAAARVLNERTAKECNVDAGDQWRWYSDGFKDDARAAIAAALNASGCVLVPAKPVAKIVSKWAHPDGSYYALESISENPLPIGAYVYIAAPQPGKEKGDATE